MTTSSLIPVIVCMCLVFGCVSDTAAQEKKPAQGPEYYYVKFETTMGDFILELDAVNAPITVDNFLTYVKSGFYDSTIFHRVIESFVIQGGGFEPGMKKKQTRPPIKNEWQNGLKNDKYTISMARRGGQPHSATSQFFINVADNESLDYPRDGAGYAVFGRIIDGKDVIEKMKKVKTHQAHGHKDVPVVDIVVTHASVIEAPPKR